ncbi:hypothetical protein P9112_009210 [Eukaryota sp. TZLM1-RC]
MYRLRGQALSYVLRCGQYTVGRRQHHHIHLENLSVSRDHATITVSEGPTLHIKDTSSEGSFIDEQPIPRGTTKEVQPYSQIRFAESQNTFIAEPLILNILISSSIVSSNQLASVISSLGCTVFSSWSSSITHLVCSSFNFSSTGCLALASAIPIVTPSWLEKLNQISNQSHQQSSQSNQRVSDLPPLDDYLPSIPAQLRNLATPEQLLPDLNRKSLLSQISVFIEDPTQKTTIEPLIKALGGIICETKEFVNFKYLIIGNSEDSQNSIGMLDLIKAIVKTDVSDLPITTVNNEPQQSVCSFDSVSSNFDVNYSMEVPIRSTVSQNLRHSDWECVRAKEAEAVDDVTIGQNDDQKGDLGVNNKDEEFSRTEQALVNFINRKNKIEKIEASKTLSDVLEIPWGTVREGQSKIDSLAIKRKPPCTDSQPKRKRFKKQSIIR